MALRMAYGALLASLPDEQVYELRDGTRATLEPSRIAYCSHLIAYWVEEQPLGKLLGEAVDGGELLREDFRHPLLPPAFHDSYAVRDIQGRLVSAWKTFLEEQPALAAEDWYRIEISGVIELFTHASSLKEGVVRFLEPPHDEERARYVVIPLARTDFGPVPPNDDA